MKHTIQPISTHTLILAVGLTLGALMTLAVTATADGDPTTDNVQRQLPYQGILEVDGQPLHAVGSEALLIRFQLYDGPEALEPVYSQEIAVEVYSGRFTAILGPEGVDPQGNLLAIDEVIGAADDLHLGMTLLNTQEDPEDDIVLSNRQRIHATPYAMWSATASAFNVASNLNAGGNLRIGGTTHLGTGRPPSGAAQLHLDTNLAEGAPDDFNDFQLLLNQGASVAQSHGLGVQEDGTVFISTSEDVAFYGNGQEQLRVDGNTLRANNIEASGEIRGNFKLNVTGEASVQRNNSGGNSTANIGSQSRRFCFLTRVSFIDIDGGNERARCEVFISGGNWQLRARLDNTGDADAYCSARCITW
ncbi:MAG: hypothetical protein AAFS10_00865 [Myxococcota bacterium]